MRPGRSEAGMSTASRRLRSIPVPPARALALAAAIITAGLLTAPAGPAFAGGSPSGGRMALPCAGSAAGHGAVKPDCRQSIARTPPGTHSARGFIVRPAPCPVLLLPPFGHIRLPVMRGDAAWLNLIAP